MSKRVLGNLVVFLAVFLVMCVWAVRNVVTIDAIEDPYEIEVDLGAASGLAANAEVAYLGVHYGRVGSIELVDGGVRATLKIDRDRHIPEGSVARVFRKSAIGEPYIDFQPPAEFDHDGADADDYLQAGDVVPVEDTRTPIEFSELLRTASEVISAIDPDRAATLLHELALALDGRGEDLRQLTEDSDRLAATFAERTDVLDRLAVNNTRLTATFADHRTALGQSLSDLAALAESLRASSGDTRILLDRGTALLAEVGDLVDDVRPDLDCLLDDLVAVNARGAAPEQLGSLARHLDIGPTAYALFADTRDIEPDGPWVRVNLLIAPEDATPQHVPALELPPVPVVQPCQGVAGSAGSAAVPTGDVALSSLVDADAGVPAVVVVAGSAMIAAVLAASSILVLRRRRG